MRFAGRSTDRFTTSRTKEGMTTEHTRRVAVAVMALVGIVLALGVGASGALGARHYECEITGDATPSPDECNGTGGEYEGHFGEVWGVAVDNQDNVWIANAGKERLEKFDSNGNFKARIEKFAQYNGYARSIAFDDAANSLLLSSSGYNEIFFFDQNAQITGESRSLVSGACCFLVVGADNSGGPNDGDFYVMTSPGPPQNGLSVPEIYKFDKEGHPISFTASTPYIKEDPCGESSDTCTGTMTIQGTPAGPLQTPALPMAGIAVNSEGNLYVSEPGRAIVLEFNPAGEYLGEITGTPEGHFEGTSGIAIDPTNDHVIVADPTRKTLEEFDSAGGYVDTIEGAEVTEGKFYQPVGVAVDSTGRLYEADGGYGNEASDVIHRFGPSFTLPRISYSPETNITRTAATINASVNPQSGPPVTTCTIQYGKTTAYGSSLPCQPDPGASPPGSYYTASTETSTELSALSAGTVYHYRVLATTAEGTRFGKDRHFETAPAVNSLLTLPATNVDDKNATLNGSFEGLGEENFYYFEWGTNSSYGGTTPELSAGSAAGAREVHAAISGLQPITTYHYRVVVRNSTGISRGADQSFKTLPALPVIELWSSGVKSDTATLDTRVNPGGGDTKIYFEYGTSTSYGNRAPITDEDIGEGITFAERNQTILGVEPGQTYHYRVVATNSRGTVQSEDRSFHTFPVFEVLHDPCPNAVVRKQVNASLLLDCRAYELASAGNAGGYDVNSDLVPGQTPLPGYPEASGRLLYSVHYGAIPGTGNPTNFGADPYVATRGADGWTTRYVGIPANGTPSVGPFSSTLLAADDDLSTFLFGGGAICRPCFADGSTGIPARLPDGELTQGMAGSLDPGPSAGPEGSVAKPLSGDGRHLVFGSTLQYESDGNSGGDLTIYDRNLVAGTTHVVSKTPAGGTMTGSGIAELDLSQDGDRILIGRKISEDADGNVYWHLYMNIGDSSKTVDLTPGVTQGVMYDGMTSDGDALFVTTPDRLVGSDTDNSADLYRLDVSPNGVTPTLISVGNGEGNSNSCSPQPNDLGAHWNAVGGAGDCSVVAVGGGGGVAPQSGAVYFLSPEVLAPGAIADQPNLYGSQAGSAPEYVSTLGPKNPLVEDSVSENAVRHTADFQVTPDGHVAVFTSRLSPTGYDNNGHSEVYRFDAGTESVDCVSCPSTNARATGDATLASHGSSLSDDGRVFFTTTEPLVLRDLNEKKDAYEWSAGEVAPLSSGSSPLDSGLFSVSADGRDAYFFTHETFVGQDGNGNTMKIYDAREDGGYLVEPPRLPCQASDECHGPGSPQPLPPEIRTVTGSHHGQTKGAKAKRCAAGSVRRHGKCVKRKSHRKRRTRHGRSGKDHG